ncbi:hypothetical protein BH23GEM9_BH23GEM9_28910 [soil metagenome]
MRVLVLTVFVLLSLAACGADGPTGVTGPDNGFFRATVDGAPFNGISVVASISGNVIAVASAELNSRTFGIAWIDEGTGTYEVGEGSGSAANGSYIEGNLSWTASAIGGAGSIVVTERTDSRIRGTFSFTLVPTAASGATGNRNVTQGSFEVLF